MITANAFTQTDFKSTPLNTMTKLNTVKKGVNGSSNTPNTKEDAHLLATIRGMRVDLAIKEKAMQRLTRELDDCKKTNKKIQKERDGKPKKNT